MYINAESWWPPACESCADPISVVIPKKTFPTKPQTSLINISGNQSSQASVAVTGCGSRAAVQDHDPPDHQRCTISQVHINNSNGLFASSVGRISSVVACQLISAHPRNAQLKTVTPRKYDTGKTRNACNSNKPNKQILPPSHHHIAQWNSLEKKKNGCFRVIDK